MKLALGTVLLVLLAGTTMYGQEQDKEKEKPAQQEEKKQEPPAKEHEQPKPQEQQKPQDQQKAQHQAQEQQKNQAKQTEKEKSDAAKQQQQAAHQQQQQAAKQQQQAAKQQQVEKQQQVARQDHAQNEQAQRDGGNRNTRRISEQDFHAHFGREHTFRVARSNDHRFNYGGYYWVYNDPWPSGWAYTDAVYVDEIDGEYYLIDPVHPGLRLLIVIAD
jgi:hypothetical protein